MCTRSRSLVCVRGRVYSRCNMGALRCTRPRGLGPSRVRTCLARPAGRSAWHVSCVACPLAVRCRLCSATAIERASCTTRAPVSEVRRVPRPSVPARTALSAAWRRCIARPLAALCAARTLGRPAARRRMSPDRWHENRPNRGCAAPSCGARRAVHGVARCNAAHATGTPCTVRRAPQLGAAQPRFGLGFHAI